MWILKSIVLAFTVFSAKTGTEVTGLLTWPRFYNGTVFSASTSAHSANNSSYKREIGSDTDNTLARAVPQSLEETPGAHSNMSGTVTPSSNVNDDLENLCRADRDPTSTKNTHRHPHLCNVYIECGPSGTMFVRRCGPGTVFNPLMGVCDWPRNVEGCHENDDVNNDLIDSRRRKRSISSKRKDTTDFTGISPDPKHCNNYRLLSSAGGHYSTHKCGDGTLFNPLSSTCDFADNVDCSSRIADFGRYACSNQDNYRAPHPDLCDKFVECDRGTLAVKSCPPGTLYKRENEKCEHAYRVQCRKRISLEHDIARVKRDYHHHQRVNKRQVSNRLNLACTFNYIAPHPDNCHQFVECEQARIFIKNCGPGTAFNPRLGQCDWPYNVRQADPQDCTRFRQCVRTRYEARRCDQGQIYDERLGRCRPPQDYREQECQRGYAPPPPRTTTTTTTERYVPFITPKPS